MPKLIIRRKFGLFGAANTFIIRINGKVAEEVKNGKSVVLEIPEGNHQISVGNSKEITYDTESEKDKMLVAANNPMLLAIPLIVALLLLLYYQFAGNFRIMDSYIWIAFGVFMLPMIYFSTLGKDRQVVVFKKPKIP